MNDPLLSPPKDEERHRAGGDPAAEAAPAVAPQRYQVRKEIGRGFSSIVYEALDTLRGRTVALKVLTLGQSLSEDRRQDMAERFLREARAISALSHPNIVSIYEVGQAGDGRHFISMELLSGESLRARMDREAPLGADAAVPIALQTADALEYAHARGIVHRDVKPDNIYVLPDGRVKLMDFGVAHIVSEGTLTQTGTVVGSPAYMSPEQISGLPLSGSSDVFSLGVTLAEMLTGHKPFDAPSIPAVMNRILHRPPQVDGVQPRALRKVLDKALAKPQAARYSSAGLFAEALRRQAAPGLASTLSTDTIIMPSPLPRVRTVAPEAARASTGTLSDLPQEPPSRAALWTFSVAGLALLACAPFALSHLSPTPTPTASASVRALPLPAQSVAERVPAAHMARIPAAWGRQPAAAHILPAATLVPTGERHGHKATPAHAALPAPKPLVLVSKPAAPKLQVGHQAQVAAQQAAQADALAAQRQAQLSIDNARHQARVSAATAQHQAHLDTVAAQHQASLNTVAAQHQAHLRIAAAQHQAHFNNVIALHQARVSAAAARPAAPAQSAPTPHAQVAVARQAPHAAPVQVAAAPKASVVMPRRAAPRPVVVRVAASREEHRLVIPAPASRPAPSIAAPAPRPVVIPDGPPHVLRRAAAVYPDTMRAGGIGGSVLIRVSVNAQGAVTEATVVRSSGTDDLDAAALDAVGHWFYEPAYQGGHAVPAAAVARIDFRP